MKTFRLVYVPDPDDKRYLTLFAQGFPYKFLGLFPTDRHLIELTADGSTPRFPSCILFFFGLDARDVLLRRGLSRGFLPFGLRSRRLAARCFLTSGLLTLRLQLCCSRFLDTCRFLTSCQQTLRLQLCRNPSLGFDARRDFLAS